jgi:hypothetical protein
MKSTVPADAEAVVEVRRAARRAERVSIDFEALV